MIHSRGHATEYCNSVAYDNDKVKDIACSGIKALRHGPQRFSKYLICIFENQIIPCFTIFRIMYLFKIL